jgi:hypothetical protein
MRKTASIDYIYVTGVRPLGSDSITHCTPKWRLDRCKKRIAWEKREYNIKVELIICGSPKQQNVFIKPVTASSQRGCAQRGYEILRNLKSYIPSVSKPALLVKHEINIKNAYERDQKDNSTR